MSSILRPETEIEELTSLMGKFHKDFIRSSKESDSMAKKKDQRERGVETKMKLSQAKSVNNVSNISNVSTVNNSSRRSSIVKASSNSIKDQKTALKSVIIPSNEKMVSGLGDVLEKEANKNRKQQKSIFKNSIIQARIAEGVFGIIKSFLLDGASDADRIVHSVEQVENALRFPKEERKTLDQRTQFEKFTNNFGGANMFKTLSQKLGKFNGVGDLLNFEKIGDVIAQGMGAVHGFATGTASNVKSKTGGASGVKGAATDFMSSFADSLKSAFSSSKVKSKSKAGGESIASNFLGDMIDSLKGSKLLSKKSAFLGLIATFGDSSDLAISAAITNPLKTLKLGYKAFKESTSLLLSRSYLQGIAASTVTFGAWGGAISAVLIPLGKMYQFFNREVPSIGDFTQGVKDKVTGVFTGIYTSVKKGAKKVKDKTPNVFGSMFSTMTMGSKKMLKNFKKKLGKKMIMTGIALGGLGGLMMTAMVGIWGLAIAAMPFVLGGLIAAAVAGLMTYIWTSLTDDSLSEGLSKFGDNIVWGFNNMWETIKTSVSAAWEGVTSFFADLFNSIVDGIESAIRALPFTGNLIADTLFGKEGAADAKPTISAKDNSRANAINNAIDKNNGGGTTVIQENKEQSETMKLILKQLQQNGQGATIVQPNNNVEDLATLLVTAS